MRALAVGAPKRLPNGQKIPAAAERRPGFNARGWVALGAPNGTPANAIAKVSDALRKAVTDPEIQKKVEVTGNYMQAMSPKDVMDYINAEQQMWKPILGKIAATK